MGFGGRYGGLMGSFWGPDGNLGVLKCPYGVLMGFGSRYGVLIGSLWGLRVLMGFGGRFLCPPPHLSPHFGSPPPPCSLNWGGVSQAARSSRTKGTTLL